MPLVYPNLGQVQEMNRDQLLFLYRNLPTASNPREIEVIREVSILLGPNPVPDLYRQAHQQAEEPTPVSSFTEPTTISDYHRLDHPVSMTATLVENRDKSYLLQFFLEPTRYGMLKFKEPVLKVFFPKTKVNKLSNSKWEIEREILSANIKVSYSKYRDYVKSKYNATIPETAYLQGGITI